MLAQEVIHDPDATAREAKYIVKGDTGIIMDDFMERHFSPWDENHVERPERLTYIRERLGQLGLIERCKQIPASTATYDELLLFHSSDHLQYLHDLVDGKVDDLQAECCKHDIYVNKDSLEVARLAAGSAIQLTKDIITGKVQNGMCVTRPPGHHAMKVEPNGFCLCNNVGIAAKYALANSFQKVQSEIDCSASNQEAFLPSPEEKEK